MFDFKNNFKDAFTNLLALVGAVIAAIQTYLATQPGTGVDWKQVVLTVIITVVSWFTGKTAGGTTPPAAPKQ